MEIFTSVFAHSVRWQRLFLTSANLYPPPRPGRDHLYTCSYSWSYPSVTHVAAGQVQQRSGASANDMLHMRYWHGDGFYISYVYSHINISVFVSSLQQLFTCDYDTPSHTQTFQLRSPAVNTAAGLSALPEDNPACHRTLESNWWPSSWKTTRSNQWSTVAPISGQIWQKGMKNYGRASRAAENKRPRIHKKSRREADGLQQQRIMSTFTSTSAADTGSRKYED